MSLAMARAEPECPNCGRVLPDHWRLDHDASRWECRRCRTVHEIHEVIGA